MGKDMNAHSLDKEMARYETELAALLQEHENKFAIIKGTDPIVTYDTFDDALNAGYEKYGLEPFLVRQIVRVPPVLNFTRFSLSTECRA